MVTDLLPRNKYKIKKETVTAKTLKTGKLMFYKLKKQIDYICNDLTYLKLKNMENLKSIFTIFIVLLTITVGYGQKVDLGLYPLASLTSQSIDYKKSKCNYINTIDVHPGETNTYWSDAYLLVSYKPRVEFFNSSLGNFRFYEDFLDGAGITGSVTATWQINGNGTHHIAHTTSIVYHSFNEEHDLLLSPPIFPDNKEYFGKACEEIKNAGGICNREELARRGYAPQLIELKFDVTISGVKYVEQKLEQLKKRKDLIEQGTVLYSQGKCTEAVPLFKEALKVVTDQKLKSRLGLNKNDADIQFKIDDCEKSLVIESNNQEENNFNNQNNESYDQITNSPTIEENKTTNTQEATELDFWGNPVASETKNGKANTVNYGGMEVEDNEHYRSQMNMRNKNTEAEEAWEQDQKTKRYAVDNYNNAIYQQAQQGITQTDKNIDEMEKAKSQLNYSSGDRKSVV